MRMYLVSFLFVLLVGCSTAFAQQPAFVAQDDRNEPCRRFKMRVLIPANNPSLDLTQRKPSESIDPKMVWNPCGLSDLQIVSVPSKPGENAVNDYVVVPLEVLEQRLKTLRFDVLITPKTKRRTIDVP
jgi:hypothetical protein